MAGSNSQSRETTKASVDSLDDELNYLFQYRLNLVNRSQESNPLSNHGLAAAGAAASASASASLGNRYLVNKFINGHTLPSNMHSVQQNSWGPIDHMNEYDVLYRAPNNFAGGPSMAVETSLLGNPADEFLGIEYYSLFCNTGQSTSCNHHRIGSTRSNSNYSGNGYNLPNSILGSSDLLNKKGTAFDYGEHKLFPERSSVARLALDVDGGINGLERLLKDENPDYVRLVLDGGFKSLYDLMTDPYAGHKLFKLLIWEDKYYLLERVVCEITFQNHSLDGIACTKYGSYSIQELIIQIKGLSELANLVTNYLSMPHVFNKLMTNMHGRCVITKCFTVLKIQANEVLYEATLRYCLELAKDPMGCVSLQECLKNLKAQPHRDRLLHCISDNSLILSFDPSGNFVVQHVLGLHNPVFTHKICYHLKGEYLNLSLLKNGSHLVEKCVRTSICGLFSFFEDVVQNEDMIKKLARDQFGNFVIQTALVELKKVPDRIPYEFLVRTLQPHLSHLEKTKAGRHVVRMIRGDAGLQNWFGP